MKTEHSLRVRAALGSSNWLNLVFAAVLLVIAGAESAPSSEAVVEPFAGSTSDLATQPAPRLAAVRAMRPVTASVAVAAVRSNDRPDTSGGTSRNNRPNDRRHASPDVAAQWEEMVEAEELLISLEPNFKGLARSLQNFHLPDALAEPLFGDEVRVIDIVGVSEPASPQDPNGVTTSDFLRLSSFPLGDEAKVSREDLSLWTALIDRFRWLDQAKFGVERAVFDGPKREAFLVEAKVAAAGELASGGRGRISARVHLGFGRREGLDPEDAKSWRIEEWRTISAELAATSGPMFEEVLDLALPDPATRERARRSVHEELVEAYLGDRAGFAPPHRHFSLSSHDRHPGLAVVDIDADGDDDLYVMSRWGPNELYVKQEDGTFREEAARFGLDLAGPQVGPSSGKDGPATTHSASAVFADFDNDGDPDVLIGRTLAPSLYLRNEDGRFVDRSQDLVDGDLPALVSAVSAADVDGDGLLDLYLSTYAAKMMEAELQLHRQRKARDDKHHFDQPSLDNPSLDKPGSDQHSPDQPDPDRHREGEPRKSKYRDREHAADNGFLADFLSASDALRLEKKVSSSDFHEFRALPGPPNVLLRNLGDGRFAVADEGHPLRVFANSYQASWADYDNDGDADLYVANDFATNQLFRNDGGGSFVDVTEATGTADIGFGMGVGWGDFDEDGRQDLYVSNMYSKAGGRVTGHFDSLDPRFGNMARGNTLFRNEGERFKQVSGRQPPAALVEVAGWSWGGQATDFNSDGRLDLFVLSGYYTTPRRFELPVDL